MAAKKNSDPPIDEVRAARHRISARFGHDTAKLVAHYMELQKKYADRLLYSVEDEVKNGRQGRKRKAQ